MHTKVKDEKIEGHPVELSVDDNGQWFANSPVLEGASVGKTIQEARSKITARLRRETVKLAVKAHLVNALPPAIIDEPWYKRERDKTKPNLCYPITLTGFSQRSNDVMFRIGDEKTNRRKPQFQTHSDPDSIGIVVRQLTAAEVDGYRKLRDAYDDARVSLQRWIEERKIENVATFLEQKVSEAVDRVDEPDVDETGDPRIDNTVRKLKESATKKKPDVSGRRFGKKYP
jgi:hypothetical protein